MRQLGSSARKGCADIFSFGGPNHRRGRMLLPRFSIRTALVMLTVGAVGFLIVGMGFRGQHWAWGASIGLLSLLVTALIHAIWFAVIRFFAQLGSASEKGKGRATDG